MAGGDTEDRAGAGLGGPPRGRGIHSRKIESSDWPRGCHDRGPGKHGRCRGSPGDPRLPIQVQLLARVLGGCHAQVRARRSLWLWTRGRCLSLLEPMAQRRGASYMSAGSRPAGSGSSMRTCPGPLAGWWFCAHEGAGSSVQLRAQRGRGGDLPSGLQEPESGHEVANRLCCHTRLSPGPGPGQEDGQRS